jgi:hypothetical protein
MPIISVEEDVSDQMHVSPEEATTLLACNVIFQCPYCSEDSYHYSPMQQREDVEVALKAIRNQVRPDGGMRMLYGVESGTKRIMHVDRALRVFKLLQSHHPESDIRYLTLEQAGEQGYL